MSHSPADVDSVLDVCRAAIDEERTVARITVVSGPDAGLTAAVDLDGTVLAGRLPEGWQEAIRDDATTLMGREQNSTVSYDDLDVFVESINPSPRLYIFGAVHIAQALTTLATHVGYKVIVSDSRSAFLTRQRFPEAVDLLDGWPSDVADRLVFDGRSFVVVLSHDARFEDPLWPLVMGRPVRYIGAMGSSRTATARRERLQAAGYSEEEVDRIHGPIGIEIGARTPEEVAVAILAEMTQDRYQSDRPMDLKGEIRRITK